MRVVVCPELGPPDVLEIETRDELAPRPGQVVVDVRAAGVNYVDALFIAGDYQIKPPVPFVPGSEVAGTVASLGEGVVGLEVGDRVIASCGLGGYAEQVAVTSDQAVPIPDRLGFAPAATFTQSYCTAMFALRERAGFTPGETILVLGAGGGVGLATIDVATALGLRAIGAASTPEKRAAATAMGADAVIDTSTEDIKVRARELTDGRGVDLVLDPVGGELAEAALRALAYQGRYIVIGFAGGSIPRLPLNQVLLKNRSIIGVDWGAWGMLHGEENRALLDELLTRVDAGTLRPTTPTTFAFADAAEALVALLARRITGKVALVP